MMISSPVTLFYIDLFLSLAAAFRYVVSAPDSGNTLAEWDL